MFNSYVAVYQRVCWMNAFHPNFRILWQWAISASPSFVSPDFVQVSWAPGNIDDSKHLRNMKLQPLKIRKKSWNIFDPIIKFLFQWHSKTSHPNIFAPFFFALVGGEASWCRPCSPVTSSDINATSTGELLICLICDLTLRCAQLR